MKHNYDFIFTLLVFSVTLIGGAIFAFSNDIWGTSEKGALYFLAAVIGSGLFWIGINIKKK